MAHRYVWITLPILIVLCIVNLSKAQNNDPRYIGCYEDSNSFRAVGWMDYTNRASAPMTVDVCAVACATHKEALSGLINGNECWCANNSVISKTKCSGRGCCDIYCQGNASQTCGGTLSFDVYEAVVDRRYLGCYSDPKSSRIFKHWTYRYPSTSECIQHCSEKNYTFAGTQYGEECWCGSGNYSKNGRCISESSCICNSPCHLNQTEKCGGDITMSVYKAVLKCKEPGQWGTDCQLTCNCYNGAGCHIKDGRCPNMKCASGWKGNSCNEKCNDGTFGINCTKSCHCQDGEICNKTDGKCPSGVCSPGYDAEADPSCQAECETGKFGLQCKFDCKCNKDRDCDKTTGACADNECLPGFTGPQNNPACQSECEDGAFGVNCVQECHCLNSEACDRKTGHCPDGICAAGYNLTDEKCQTECQTGTYGVNCKQMCECSNTEECDKVTEVCKKDRKINALVPIISSLLGVAVLVIAILVAVILCRRRNHEIKQRQMEIPDVIQHHEEEPYHLYRDITDTPADQAVENKKSTPLPETIMEKNQVQGQCKYVNIGGDAFYVNTNHIYDNAQRNSVYKGVEKPKQDEHNYLRLIK